MTIDGKDYFDGKTPYTFAFVGGKGEGKTTLIKTIFDSYPGNAIYYSFRPDDKGLNGTLVKDLSEIKEFGKYKSDMRYIDSFDFLNFIITLRNTLVILDDLFALIEWNIPKNLKSFLINNRGFNCDTIMVFHGFKYVPKQAFLYVNFIFAWRTKEGISNDLLRLPSGDRIVKAHTFLSKAPKHTKVFIPL